VRGSREDLIHESTKHTKGLIRETRERGVVANVRENVFFVWNRRAIAKSHGRFEWVFRPLKEAFGHLERLEPSAKALGYFRSSLRDFRRKFRSSLRDFRRTSIRK
jgi:hypothetical protein